MVEAAVVLPVLVLFFGVLLFCFRAQESRLDVQAEAHRDALAFASQGCEGDLDVSTAPGFTVGDPPPPRATALARGAAGDRSVSRELSMAKSSRERVVEVGRMRSKARSEWTVLCNETPTDEGPLGFFDYGVKTASSYFPKKPKVK